MCNVEVREKIKVKAILMAVFFILCVLEYGLWFMVYSVVVFFFDTAQTQTLIHLNIHA